MYFDTNLRLIAAIDWAKGVKKDVGDVEYALFVPTAWRRGSSRLNPSVTPLPAAEDGFVLGLEEHRA